MINKLYKLANKLDKNELFVVADEIDLIIKNAIKLTPEREKQIQESWEKYFADPEKRERDLIEQEYGLGAFSEDEDSFGLETKPWHGHKWSYEGFPKDKSEHSKKFERYQTIIGDESDLPEKIEDPSEGGTWIKEQVFDKPSGATKGTFQTVYRFVDSAQAQRKKELWGEDEQNAPVALEEVGVSEEPRDEVETEEKSPSGIGGTFTF